MITSSDIFNNFKMTMAVLENGLQVIYITTPADQLLCCQLVELKELRNDIAHSGKTSDEDNILQTFIDRLRMAHNWIKSIEKWQSSQASTLH